MKKLVCLMMAGALLLLVACGGVPQEKLEAAKTNYAKLEELATRTETAVASLNGSAVQAGVAQDGHFDPLMAHMDTVKEDYGQWMDKLEELKEEDVDTLNESLDAELAAQMPRVENLEAAAVEFSSMLQTVNDFMADVATLTEMVQQVEAPTKELQDRFQEVGLAAGEVNERLEEVLDSANLNDPASMLESFRQANTMLGELHTQIQQLTEMTRETVQPAAEDGSGAEDEDTGAGDDSSSSAT